MSVWKYKRESLSHKDSQSSTLTYIKINKLKEEGRTLTNISRKTLTLLFFLIFESQTLHQFIRIPFIVKQNTYTLAHSKCELNVIYRMT